MNAVSRFSERAACYNQFRWAYDPKAIRALVEECNITTSSVIADIGAGTGMLTRHFAGLAGTVYGVEPSAEMRAIAARNLYGTIRYIDGVADATTLPNCSVDMITVGRALHWFPPDSTKTEFQRILRTDGWMAIFSVPCTDAKLMDALARIRVEDNGWDIAVEKTRMTLAPLSFYFGHDSFRKLSFPGSVQETWDVFIGRISSLGPAPGKEHPLRPRLERALREMFEQYAIDGLLHVPISTEVSFGHIHRTSGKEEGA
jgi:SAM-dependent methyltransferase